jgi:phage terminase large subunit
VIDIRDLHRRLASLQAEMEAAPADGAPAFEPRPYQADLLEYLRGGGKRAVCVWHRRAGKDLTLLHWMAEAAQERVGLYWHLMPSARQCRKAIWNGFLRDGRRIIDTVFPPAIRGAKPNETEMMIELANGSIVQLVGSDGYDRLVGSNPIGVTFSEYALAKPQAWDYIRPILAENDGWAAFISTPRGRNALWKLYEVAGTAPGWFRQQLDIYATGALPPSVIDEERAAGMPDALINSEYLVSFDAAQVGAVYGDLLEQLGKRGGISIFETKNADKVITSWDLGMGDATAIWFWRVEGERVDLLDYYEASGKPFSHYADVIEARGYKYEAHFFPHDARQRNYQTGVTTLDLARERLGQMCSHIPIMPVDQGIMAARWLLQQEIRIHEKNCEAGIEALRAYFYSFDEERRVFSNRPEHSWASHGSDAFRYAATVARFMAQTLRPPEPPKPAHLEGGIGTLDDAWSAYDRAQEA